MGKKIPEEREFLGRQKEQEVSTNRILLTNHKPHSGAHMFSNYVTQKSFKNLSCFCDMPVALQQSGLWVWKEVDRKWTGEIYSQPTDTARMAVFVTQ